MPRVPITSCRSMRVKTVLGTPLAMSRSSSSRDSRVVLLSGWKRVSTSSVGAGLGSRLPPTNINGRQEGDEDHRLQLARPERSASVQDKQVLVVDSLVELVCRLPWRDLEHRGPPQLHHTTEAGVDQQRALEGSMRAEQANLHPHISSGS